MLSKFSRILAKLRREQPALILLPVVIATQIVSSMLSPGNALLIASVFIFLLARIKRFQFIFCACVLGLISDINVLSTKKQSFFTDAIALVRISDKSLRRIKNGQLIFDLKVLFAESDKSAIVNKNFRCKAVNLPWKNISSAQPADYLQIKADFRIFSDKIWPWEYEASLKRRAIHGTCRIRYVALYKSEQRALLSSLKHSLSEYLRYYLGDNEITGLILSLSLGFRDLISASTDRAFKDLGISHVLVLSGMQIGLFFFTFYKLIKTFLHLFSIRPVYKITASNLIASIFTLFIVAIADYESSALRAWFACSLFAIASNLERRTGIFKVSLASLLLLCLVWPGCWAEAGLQLSFAAIFGLAFGQVLAKNRLQAILYSGFMATVLTTLLVIIWFGECSVSSVISNFILSPLLGVVGCYIGFTIIILSFLPTEFAINSAYFLKYIFSNIFDFAIYVQILLPKLISVEELNKKIIVLLILIIFIFCIKLRLSSWIKEFSLLCGRDRLKDRRAKQKDIRSKS